MADSNILDVALDEPRSYTAVDCPPSLPQEFEYDLQGEIVYKHWSKQCGHYTTRLSENGQSFEVRPINHNDTTGEGKFQPGDWPVVYRLGPPSNLPDFHPLIEKFGLQVLEAAGFVNQKISREPNTTGAIGPLHFQVWRNPTANLDEMIHPVLREDMWRGNPPVAYKLMRPALLLASAVLDDPTTLSYFFALSEPMTIVNNPGFTTPCHIMMQPPALTDAQMQIVYDRICAMRQWTTWNWEESSNSEFNRYGVTCSRIDAGFFVQASAVDTHQSDIYLSSQFIPLLLEYERATRNGETSYNSLQNMAGIPADKRIEVKSEGVLARTIVTLAVTILHEFVHAFSKAYFPKPFLQHPFEPWFMGKRSNEQGCAFEDYVFGGIIRSLTLWVPPMSLTYDGMQNLSAPFGLWYYEHYDQWVHNDPNGNEAVMDDLRPVDPSAPLKFWPIPQEWCQRLLTDGMWNDQVLRFGQRAYKLPRFENWAMYRWSNAAGVGRWTTGQARWNADPPFSEPVSTWL